MSHLHLPDGVLPPEWLALGLALAAAGLLVATWQLRRVDRGWLVPRLGIVSALMLLAMSVELGFLDYHVNLTVLAGILLGPAGGFVSAFTANIFSAFLGHGGLTVTGLNATLNGLEAVGGAVFFQAWRRVLPFRPGLAAGLATLPALALSTTIRLLILYHTGIFGELLAEGGAAGASLSGGSFQRFALLLYLFGAVGWVLETVLIGGIVGFLTKARPGLLAGKEAR